MSFHACVHLLLISIEHKHEGAVGGVLMIQISSCSVCLEYNLQS